MNDHKQLQKAIRDTLNTFLSTYPLYKKLEIFDFYAGLDERDITFEAYCKIDKKETPFKIEDSAAESLKHNLKVSGLYLSKNSTYELEFTVHCSATCQLCGNAKYQLLLMGKSSREKGELKMHIQKAGQFPPVSVEPDRVLREFMTDEDINFYKRGKLNLGYNYGIGAYAYFRRILENEILNIAHRIINSNEEAKPIISAAVEQYFKFHNTSKLIEALSPYLPKSLLINKENPLFHLHSKLSEGMHGLGEDECTELAKDIETVLRYVIIEMRERETKDEATNSFKKLRGNP